MAAIEPQALYTEYETDPNGYGYAVGNGVKATDKINMINEARAEIQIQRIAADKDVAPGEVSEFIPVQLIRDAIDPDEYKLNCAPDAGDDEVIIGQKETTRARILTFYGGSDGQSQFAFTDLSKAQILDLFSNANWPSTRSNLIDLQFRDGSRAEQLFGSPDAPVSTSDLYAADQWGLANGKTTLYE